MTKDHMCERKKLLQFYNFTTILVSFVMKNDTTLVWEKIQKDKTVKRQKVLIKVSFSDYFNKVIFFPGVWT